MPKTCQRFYRGQVWHHTNRDTSESNVLKKDRPVVILSCNHNNSLERCITVAPIGSGEFSNNVGLIGAVVIPDLPHIQNGYILVDQIKTISANDLERYIITLSDSIMSEVSRMVLKALVLTPGEEHLQDNIIIGIPKSTAVQEDEPVSEIEIQESTTMLPTKFSETVPKPAPTKQATTKPKKRNPLKIRGKIVLTDEEKEDLKKDIRCKKIADIIAEWGFSTGTYYRFRNEFSKEEEGKKLDENMSEDDKFIHRYQFGNRQQMIKDTRMTGVQLQAKYNELMNRKYQLRDEVKSMVI